MSQNRTLTLNIMGRDYRLSVVPEEEDALRACAQMVDARMKEINQPGRVMSPDSVAVLAALRIAYENLSHRRKADEINLEIDKLNRSAAELDALISLCDTTLTDTKEQ